LLSSWGVAFEAVDVEANPGGLEELKRLGVDRVPALIIGDRAFQGWNPRQLAAFVGVEHMDSEGLSPPEFTELLDKILAAAQRVMEQVPDENIGMKSPGRDRTVRDLGFHLFRLSLAYRDAMIGGRFFEEWLLEKAPVEMVDGEAVARYGQVVRQHLKEYFTLPRGHNGDIFTNYGHQTAYGLLERTVWHAAQHLRQLYVFLEWMGKTPVNPLTDAEFKGLPLPKEIW
jgi:hypothetical protein